MCAKSPPPPKTRFTRRVTPFPRQSFEKETDQDARLRWRWLRAPIPNSSEEAVRPSHRLEFKTKAWLTVLSSFTGVLAQFSHEASPMLFGGIELEIRAKCIARPLEGCPSPTPHPCQKKTLTCHSGLLQGSAILKFRTCITVAPFQTPVVPRQDTPRTQDGFCKEELTECIWL